MAFETRKSLLMQIKAGGDNVSWQTFFETYRPLIWLIGGDFNLSFEEKENLVQDVMSDFFNAQRHFLYDPSKGRFRDYFRRITRNRILALLKRKRRRREVDEENSAPLVSFADPDPGDLERRWEEEWRLYVLREARRIVGVALPPRMIQVFEMWYLQEMAPTRIAKTFGLSLATVYNYRNTVLDALRSAAAELEKEA